MDKTNVMRLLDVNNIAYNFHLYDSEETDGQKVAKLVNKNDYEVFKTLVTVGASGTHYVFVVPVYATLNLKKASKSVGEKWVEMIKQKDLLPLTGYIHGGCSPIGMKKPFTTIIDETALLVDTMCVSAGRRGVQIELKPCDLQNYINGKFVDII